MAMHQFQEEPANRDICLSICTNLLAHITTVVSPHPVATQGSTNHMHDNALAIMPQNDLTVPHLMTLNVLKECSNKLHDMIVHLQSSKVAGGIDSSADLRSTQTGSTECAPQQHVDERVSSGRTHVFEDVSVGDHGKQILRLPAGERWSAKRVTAGESAVQLIGAFSDISLRDCLERL